MISLTTLWVSSGFFYLGMLTFQDLTRRMNVNQGLNYIMLGITLSLTTLNNWYYNLGVIGAIMILYGVFTRLPVKYVLGDADILSFSWVITGLALISPIYPAIFTICLLFLSSVYYAVKSLWLRTDQPTPYLQVIFGAYAMTVITYAIYHGV